MKIKVKDKEFSFEGYVFPINSVQRVAERCYEQGAKEFAEWLPQHFDLRFSNNPDVWLDEFFNHTSDKVLAEWQKGVENDNRNL